MQPDGQPAIRTVDGLQRWREPFFVIACAALATTALAVRDPHQSGSWGYCPILLMTGYPCPGCGGLRAVNDLTHGRLTAALSSNLLVVLVVLAGTAFLARWCWRRGRNVDAPLAQPGRGTAWIVAMAVLVFGALRIVPGLTFLAP